MEVRLVVAAAAIVMFCMGAERNPRLAIWSLLAYLAFLGEIRRLLLYVADWSGNDPLQLVAPVSAMYIAQRLFRKGDSPPATRLSRSITVLMVIMGLQMANPAQGGPVVGIAGGLFYLVPLIWFWIGRNMDDDLLVPGLLQRVIPAIAVLTAMMGLYQATVGFLPHQQAWIENHGYAALQLAYGTARPISTFTSGAEFAYFMVLAASVAFALAGSKRSNVLLIPLFFAAIFVQGSRTPVIGFVNVLALVWAVRGQSSRLWMPRFAFALGLGLTVGYLGVSQLSTPSISPAVAAATEHQVEGLTDPLNSEHSTAGSHLDMIVFGVVRGVLQPWGYGLGATTIAAGKYGGNVLSTEIGISNMFVSLGVVGGVLYLYVVFQVTGLALRTWAETRSEIALAIGAVLACTFGQWIMGGMYSIAPVVWLLVGHLDAVRQSRAEPNEPPFWDDDE